MLYRPIQSEAHLARLATFVLTLVVATTSSIGALAPGRDNGNKAGDRLLSSAGEVIHHTDAQILGRSSMTVADGSLGLYLWDEATAAGVVTSHYAVTQAGGALLGRVRETTNKVELAGLRFDPLTEGDPTPPAILAAGPGNRLFLVQLVVTALPELQQVVVELGGTIHRYYTEHTLLVEMATEARAEVEALPFVRWVGDYHPAWRLEPVVRQALTEEGTRRTAARYSIMLTERGRTAQEALGTTIRALGGRVEVVTPRGFRMEATLDGAQLLALAHDDRVHYIDRWGGPAETDMDIVREVGGADFLEAQTGFTGQGVRGEILDTELRPTHQEWLNTPIIHSAASGPGQLHGTSSFSNVFAQGVSASARGMAPDGHGIFFFADEVTQFGGTVSRHTIAQELMDPAGPYRAVFQTSSVGNTRTFDYTSISAEMDDVLFLHQVLHTQSQSNAGNQDSRPQAWAKNIVSVGGFLHHGTADRSDDEWDFTASIGPAADGRVKPDLAFFYDSIFSASGGSDTSYTSFGGTSSATPQTAGHFAMLFQMWHEGVWAGRGGAASVFDSQPKMATAKALMIHHAYRYDWTQGGPNSDIDRFKQGWGTADLRQLYETAGSTEVIDEEVVLAPLEVYSRQARIGAGEPMLKVTLVYVDPMGTVGAGVDRINDLSLRVTSPTGTIYWGNNGLETGNVSTSGGSSNTIDTVENVFVAAPEAGLWTIEVLADEVVEDSHTETPETDADFALVFSPGPRIFADGFESGDTSAWTATVP